MKKRSSVRNYIVNKPVSKDIEKELLKSAQMASTSFNLQTYCVISIENEELRSEVALLAENQAFIKEASLFYLVCVDLFKMQKVNELARKDYFQKDYFESTLMGIIDASLFGQALAAEAEARGLGICFIGGIRSNIKKIDSLLNLPEKVIPLFGITVGYAEKKNPPKPRIGIEAIVFHNSYDQDKVQEAIKKYDEVMAVSGIYEGRQYRTDEFGFCAEYGWIEHSARRTSTKKKSKIREDLSAYFKSKNLSLD
jgi:FMN reductase (NADPH)